MKNLLSGLEAFGFKNLNNLEIYDKNDEKKENNPTETKKNETMEEDVIFDKSYVCPVCNKEFKTKAVKAGKAKLLSVDTDLRPKYQTIDCLKYDVIACPICGYAALNRYFTYLTSPQVKLIKEQISNNFRGLKTDENIYSYDTAIIRHKLSLANAVIKRGKTSEKAYNCLKTAWLIRGKIETLPTDTPNYKEIIKQLSDEESDFTKSAFEGFKEAYSKEVFPMCGMDENTVAYLIADLARRCGQCEESSRWISQVIVAKDANERLKTKARELKELLKDNK